ncbi:Crp/Fnr family transcriptional regulator [Halomonas sp. BC04]|uniref:Crp/Fnr family transcriptional regulator n=1 Tax=Halomonas sp. BC04 TaxID=1403540 RepID=UPI0003ED7D53|nr:Crp/Fnr family transcriptional regulator [Halomonas sp. BC04]EWG99470.1 Crp/Fnr family transcription regulator [Halomonas sp. BC04]
MELEHTPRRMAAGEVLWQENAEVDLFCVLKAGWAYSFRYLDNGTMQILSVYLPGDILGLRDFGFSRRRTGVAMVNEGLVSCFSHQHLFQLIRSSPALAAGLIAIVVRKQAMLTERLVYIGRHTAQQRLAHFLYEIYLRLRSIGAVEEGNFQLPLSQEQLGDVLGLSAVHVSRTFSLLREEGLVLKERQDVYFPDPQALAQMAEFNASYLDEPVPDAFQVLSQTHMMAS